MSSSSVSKSSMLISAGCSPLIGFSLKTSSGGHPEDIQKTIRKTPGRPPGKHPDGRTSGRPSGRHPEITREGENLNAKPNWGKYAKDLQLGSSTHEGNKKPSCRRGTARAPCQLKSGKILQNVRRRIALEKACKREMILGMTFKVIQGH